MGEDGIKSFRIKQKDWKLIKKLPCAEWGMNQEDIFEIMMSFCLSDKSKLTKHFEEWKKKKEK